MKLLKFILPLLLTFAIGYALGNVFPLGRFKIEDKGIQGDAKLTLKFVTTENVPVSDLEIDIAEQPGPPPKGGVAISDKNGAANFSVKPGLYYIYFNSSTFPKNFKQPDLIRMQVDEGKINEKTITLEAN